jgi:hypothetical protein
MRWMFHMQWPYKAETPWNIYQFKAQWLFRVITPLLLALKETHHTPQWKVCSKARDTRLQIISFREISSYGLSNIRLPERKFKH